MVAYNNDHCLMNVSSSVVGLLLYVARIATSSHGFYDDANRLKKKMWWKNMKLNLIILAVLVIIVIIIVRST